MDKWIGEFGLGKHNLINITLVRNLPKDGDRRVAAKVESIYPYNRFRIKIDQHFLENDSHQDIEEAIVHELYHIILSPIPHCVGKYIGQGVVYDAAADAEEGVVDTLTRLAMAKEYPERGEYQVFVSG